MNGSTMARTCAWVSGSSKASDTSFASTVVTPGFATSMPSCVVFFAGIGRRRSGHVRLIEGDPPLVERLDIREAAAQPTNFRRMARLHGVNRQRSGEYVLVRHQRRGLTLERTNAG